MAAPSGSRQHDSTRGSATAAILQGFLGNFVAAHLLLVAAVAALAGGLTDLRVPR